MTAAVFDSAYIAKTPTSSKLNQLAARFMTALIESRARTAAHELRRHEALMNDLGRRQDHSSQFLMQASDLPFKI